jgi:hypothetical protein
MRAEGLELLTADDPRWDQSLAGTAHDVFHHSGYHALAQARGDGDAQLAVYRREGRIVAWPYLVRPIAGTDLVDVGCVYGYPGPVVSRGVDPDDAESAAFLSDAWSAITSAWRDQRAVSVFTTFDPLLRNADLATGWHADASGPVPVLVTGRTVSIDLGRSAAERAAAYEKETRYEIGRARRAGLRTWVDADGTHLPDLARLYADTMRRNKADERYLFSTEYFEHLWAAVDGRARLLVAAIDDDIVGVLLYLVHGELAHAHLTGVSERHLRLAPLNAMLDATADAATTEGARLLHLGAGRGGREDSLYRFKRRIGDVEREFALGRWVLDAPRYAALAEASPAGDDGGFFPAYRAARPR